MRNNPQIGIFGAIFPPLAYREEGIQWFYLHCWKKPMQEVATGSLFRKKKRANSGSRRRVQAGLDCSGSFLKSDGHPSTMRRATGSDGQTCTQRPHPVQCSSNTGSFSFEKETASGTGQALTQARQ